MASTQRTQSGRPHHNTGFTLVELLVVIGIIVVLVSILVPVVNRARIASQNASVKQQLNRISGAINMYYLDYKAYPGYCANDAFQTGGVTATGGRNPNFALTQAEDMTMSLLGGWVYTGGQARVDLTQVGKGPMTINPLNISRRVAGPYMGVNPNELPQSANNQWKLPRVFSTDYTDSVCPEFVDLFNTHGWKPRPIIYMRANAGASSTDISMGGTTVMVSNNFNARVQYNLVHARPYVAAKGVGTDFTAKQEAFINPSSDPLKAVIVGYFSNPSGNASVIHRDGYFLFSAGADGVYGTNDDIKIGSGGAQ